MTYLSNPFQHDLFVSYAHGAGDLKRLKQWCAHLRKELEDTFSEAGSDFESIDIFIDEQLDPTEPLTEQLRDKVGHSGLLLVFMTKSYLKSAWCKDELEWFDAEIERREKKGGLVLVVRVTPTDPEIWPDSLKDERGHSVLGFQFHPNPKSDDEFIVFPYGFPKPGDDDSDYYRELAKLANIILRRLQDLRESQKLDDKARQPRVQIRIEGAPNIYLQSASSTPEERAKVKAELEGAGCRVLPEALPVVEADLAAIRAAGKERLKILRNEAHALCLLRVPQSDNFDRAIDAVASDLNNLQELADKVLPCAVIDRAGGGVPRADEFGIDIIDGRDENWLLRLRDWLDGGPERGA